MKLRLLSCLLVISTMFSVQAVTVCNETFGKIKISRFGYQVATGDVWVQKKTIELDPCEEFSPEDTWSQSFSLMTVTVRGVDYPFRDLTAKTVLTFVEFEHGKIKVEQE